MVTRIFCAVLLAAAVSGCNVDGSSTDTSEPPSTPTGAAPSSNSQPSIQGSPQTMVAAGATYSFQPVAKDGNGDTLSFAIQNKPQWATFNSATGTLSGTPGSSQVGQYSGIVISVSDGTASAALPAFSVSVTTSDAPTISGSPATTVVVGNTYHFTPAASDPRGQALTFSIFGKPSWASFDESTGELSGTPAAGDVGTSSGIVISVSDGEQSASLPAFAVAVTQTGGGSATLSWMPPQQNTDGTPLVNLAGYHVYYGTNASSLSQSVKITNPSISTYVVSDLSSGTWYFSVKAYNTKNVESDFSAKVSKTIT